MSRSHLVDKLGLGPSELLGELLRGRRRAGEGVLWERADKNNV